MVCCQFSQSRLRMVRVIGLPRVSPHRTPAACHRGPGGTLRAGMSAPVSPVHRPTGQAFRHEAFFYAGDREFLEGTLGFIREGLTQGEPVMVALSAAKIARLRAELGADAGRVRFADMAEIGSNPARWVETATPETTRT